MGTLTDEDLQHLLGEAGGSFAVTDDGPAEVLTAATAARLPWRRRRSVQLPAAAAVLALALAAGVLVVGGPDDDAMRTQLASPATEGRADESTANAVPDLAAAPAERSATTQGFATDSQAAAPAPAPAPAAAVPAQAPVPDGARVVKTGAIALLVDDRRVTPVLSEVQALASAVGGVVATSQTQESGPAPSGSVTLRVPVDRFEEVVADVRDLSGTEVRTATTSGQDVTAQYADLEAQLRTLTAARERFLVILSEARNVGDILAVQQRVDETTGQIDRLEGQRRVLAAQSEMATLEVTVTERDDPTVRETERPDDGLSKAFADAWDGFTSGVEALIRNSGRAVLLALCLTAAYVVLRLGWRASRRRLV